MARKRKGTGSGEKDGPAPTWLDSLDDPVKRAAADQDAKRRATERFLSAIREADAIVEKDPRRAAVMAMKACENFVKTPREPKAGRVFHALTVAFYDLDRGIVHATLAPTGKAGDARTRVAVFDDTVSTGGSLLGAIDAMQQFGCEVATVLCVLDRRQGGSDEVRRRGLPFRALLEADADGKVVVSPGL